MKKHRLALIMVSLLLLVVGVCVVCGSDVREISIKVQPRTLVLNSASEWVTVHTNIAYSAVDGKTVELNGVPIRWWKSDSRGNFVAKFDEKPIKDIVAPPEAAMTLTGLTKSGEAFYGVDTIPVR